MSLYRLIYGSHAAPTVQYYDLKDILEKSEKNNRPVGVTGMLCYGDDMFLQCLEGDRRILTQTYNRIAKDERHYDAELIDFVEIEHRYFTEWSMKVVQLGSLSPEKIKSILIKYSSSNFLRPSDMSGQQCIQLLLELQTFYQSTMG